MTRRALMATVLTAGCSSPQAAPPPPSPAPMTAAAITRADDGEARFLYKDASDRTLLKLKPKEKAYRLVDGNDQVLGEVKVDTDRVKLKDASDVEIRKIKGKDDGGVEIEDASGQRLYRLKVDAGGEWKIVQGDATILKCKPKPPGYELRDPAGKTVSKVKVREDRVVFETEAGERQAVLKGPMGARAAMWLAAEPLTLLERAALAVYFHELKP